MELEGEQGKKLEEISNASSRSAAEALQKMLNKKVDMSFPNVGLKSVNIIDRMSKGCECVIGISEITGDLKGNLILAYDKAKVLPLLEILTMQAPGTMKEITEDARNAFTELVNIIGGAYLSSMANQLQLRLFPNPPTYTGRLEEVKGELFDDLTKGIENIFLVTTELKISDLQAFGDLFILLDGNSLHEVLNKLH